MSHRLNPIREKKGAALVITLLVITILSGMTIGFSRESGIELNISMFSRDSDRAYQAALTGISFALLVLDSDTDKQVDSLNEEWHRFMEIDFPEQLPPGSSFTGRIADESAKLNVNLLRSKDGEADAGAEQKVTALFSSLGADENLADSLLDWLDSDDIKRLDGAESYYYGSLEIPYGCANSPLLTIRQIFLVRGFSEYRPENGENDLLDYLTIQTDGKININTAPIQVLRTLSDHMDEDKADAIIQYRETRAFLSPEDLKKVPGIDGALYQEIKDLITVKSSAFTIEVEGRYGEATAPVTCVVVKKDEGMECVYWRVI